MFFFYFNLGFVCGVFFNVFFVVVDDDVVDENFGGVDVVCI